MAFAVCRLGMFTGKGEIPPCDRALPDLVAPLALPDETAPGLAQDVAERAVELRRHPQAAAGSASRNAVIWTNTEAGSIPG